MAFDLTDRDKRDLHDILRAWREGRLVPPALGRRAPAPVPVSQFGPLWEVTTVNLTDCIVQRVDASGNPVAGSALAGVLFDGTVTVGDRGLLSRRTDGSLHLFVGGFPYTAFAGYDAGATQFLLHVSGVLTWITAGECVT